MDTKGLKHLCNGYPGAEAVLLGESMNVLSYRIHGKTFAYLMSSAPERGRFSIKITPERFLELTEVARIKPAR